MTIDRTAIDGLKAYIIERALLSPVTPEVFRASCERLLEAGLPVLRINMSWGTLHPTIGALSLRWWKGRKFDDITRYMHQDGESEEWLRSPGYYAVHNQIPEFHVFINDETAHPVFPVFDEFKEAGGTHYFLRLIRFSEPSQFAFDLDGMILSFLSDAPNGFSNEEMDILRDVGDYIALALKIALRERITLNTLSAYLGENAAHQVLSGSIKLGDGNNINAVIWYSDLRNSTVLGDQLSGPDLLATLNSYFACTAGAVSDHGGEVLRFVGDAVLAIFPIHNEDVKEACAKATAAAKDSLARLDYVNAQRAPDQQLSFGLGLHIGEVMFGNIGIPERLDFSVTGPAANEVARIENMTKEIGETVLASQSFASHQPDQWRAIGPRPLRGVGCPVNLFTLK
ncbi:adenylate cyclase [Terasakiella brassicae]|uniref:Adenylate cyclase n=1 Tax=Terasakiella brassicae TaxID=1634917 RepID=A0A917BXI8_9PROT|nr:adenylate/guanylate cyclase domain-containing protein [Terasakiella brassicae]GGF60578.1 adenylate cyclase [Terasakiella brassicae]